MLEQFCLFESGSDGYHTYRIPALAVSARGTILAFCEARMFSFLDHGRIDLCLRRSFDNGRTWEPRQILIADGERTCGSPCPVVDGDRILLPFCKDSQEVFVMTSDDDGASWSEPVEITESAKDPFYTYVGTGPGHGIRLQSGRLLFPSWIDEGSGPVPTEPWRRSTPDGVTIGGVQSSYMIFSDDHGASWQHGPPVEHGQSNECEAVELADGSLYMTLRGESLECGRGHSHSHDGGDTWSDIVFDDRLPQPGCLGSVIRLDDDTVILAHPSDPDKRAKLAIYASTDGCRNWPASRVLCPGASAYSDLAIADDGNILCFYEVLNEDELKVHDANGLARGYTKIVLARFSKEWIDSADA